MNRTERNELRAKLDHQEDFRDVYCSRCGAKPGEPCVFDEKTKELVNAKGTLMGGWENAVHDTRIEAFHRSTVDWRGYCKQILDDFDAIETGYPTDTSERPETGPMKFGDDWTGIFIRGDNAFFFAESLRLCTAPQNPFYADTLGGLIQLLLQADERLPGRTVQKLLPWQACSPGPLLVSLHPIPPENPSSMEYAVGYEAICPSMGQGFATGEVLGVHVPADAIAEGSQSQALGSNAQGSSDSETFAEGTPCTASNGQAPIDPEDFSKEGTPVTGRSLRDCVPSWLLQPVSKEDLEPKVEPKPESNPRGDTLYSVFIKVYETGGDALYEIQKDVRNVVSIQEPFGVFAYGDAPIDLEPEFWGSQEGIVKVRAANPTTRSVIDDDPSHAPLLEVGHVRVGDTLYLNEGPAKVKAIHGASHWITLEFEKPPIKLHLPKDSFLRLAYRPEPVRHPLDAALNEENGSYKP